MNQLVIFLDIIYTRISEYRRFSEHYVQHSNSTQREMIALIPINQSSMVTETFPPPVLKLTTNSEMSNEMARCNDTETRT